MSLKSTLYQLALISLVMSADSNYRNASHFDELSEDEKELLKAEHKINMQAKQDALKEKQGLKKFWYSQGCVWARDEKNADRKARNKGYIK